MGLFKNLVLLFSATILLLLFSSFGSGAILSKKLQSIDCPVIDYSGYTIAHPTCNKSDGSITGLKVTSTGTKILYTWHDDNGNVVGHSINLTKIPAGTYYLEVTDNSGCGHSIFSPEIPVINANLITYNDEKISIKGACSSDGSISGITAVNATSYKWIDLATGSVISTSGKSADVNNIPAGNYQLLISNSTCQLTTKTYNLPTYFMVPAVVEFNVKTDACPLGSTLSVKLNVKPTQPRLTYYFQDATGAILSTGPIIGEVSNPVPTAIGLQGGLVKLYVRNDLGCTAVLGAYNIPRSEMTISKPETVIHNDRCNQQIGYIIPTIVNGGRGSLGWSYVWTDSVTGRRVGIGKTLNKIGAGTYTFTATNDGGCVASATFTVINTSPALVPPIASGTTICLPGMINITVTNVDTSKMFRLYDSPVATTPIDSSKTGIFYRQVDQTNDFYVTRVNKDCESDRTKVTETVVVSIKIPNAFTPNGDGVNDTWHIQGIDKFPGADIKIFTRNGKLIFHSVNYAVAFNGTYNGSPLPTGAYYYIMDVKQPICYAKISGSLTIIR